MNYDLDKMFPEFVREFGGEIIPEADIKNADFVFSEDNIVAELKTLREDARQEHAERLQALVNGWARRGKLVVFGTTVISLQKLNPVLQREWLKILQAPVQNIIRTANRQIRSTKESRNLPEAKGLLLIANDGNLLHTSPTDYMNLVGRILDKKTPTGERQYSYIHGVVYFSYRVRSSKEGLPFWIAGYTTLGGDPAMTNFQDRLWRGWRVYVGKITGLPVSERQIDPPAEPSIPG